MHGGKSEQLGEAESEAARRPEAPAQAPARDHASSFLALARAVGNRNATRLILQRWRDHNGKFHDGAQPPDVENWEKFTNDKGFELWRPKTGTAPTTKPTAVVTPVATTATGAAEPDRSSTEIWSLDPNKIRYSQDGITKTFTNGTRIDDAARTLAGSPGSVGRYPAIKITKRKGRYISLDNRRLWVFKHAGVAQCPVVWATAQEVKDSTHFDSPEGTAFVGVREGSTLSMQGLVPAPIPPGFKKKYDTYTYI